MKFTIHHLRFTNGRRRSQRGIALVITLIMLAITLVMAVAFMALARRERSSVNTTTDAATARLAAETAVAQAEAQIIANILNGYTNLPNGSAYAESPAAFNLGLLVSTNYINPAASPGFSGPTNVNYATAGGTLGDWEQNIANLWYLPQHALFFPLGQPATNYDFRYYLDLNENGRFDANGMQTVISSDPANPYYDTNGIPVPAFNPPDVLSNFFVGDPEWVGVLDHPDAPHGPNNHFVARYAFIAVPAGNTLDLNYIHNQALNGQGPNTPLPANDGYMRNQGVGSWEMNLAAFLADLNTNVWGQAVGSGASAPPNSGTYYLYNRPAFANSGYAFQDAFSLLAYRYKYWSLPSANYAAGNAFKSFPIDGLDDYSQGPLQTTLDTNEDVPVITVNAANPWSGADSTNHFFALSDFLDPTLNLGGFSARLRGAGNANDTYDRYTYYRMLQELGTDSSPDDGKMNLNYSNAVVTYSNYPSGGIAPTSVGFVAGAETNLVPWRPLDFFNAAADKLLRLYTAEWFKSDPTGYMTSYYGIIPQGQLDASGLGVTNFPNYGQTNQIPAFGITNIPVLVNGSYVYSPTVNRLLQLAANLYDASTNGDYGLPDVFRPVFERDQARNVFIMGYTNLYSQAYGPNTVNDLNDPQLAAPHPITDLPLFATPNTPIIDANGLVNVYGVPWIIGAKKGLPAFNQFYMTNAVNVTRRLQFTRPSVGAPVNQTNEMFTMAFDTGLGMSFWNPYTNTYGGGAFVGRTGPMTVFAQDVLFTTLVASNGPTTYSWSANNILNLGNPGPAINLPNPWPGTQWSGLPPAAAVLNAGASLGSCFLYANWTTNFLNSPTIYRFGGSAEFPTPTFDPIGSPTSSDWETTTLSLPQLPPFYLSITNNLQAFILDGNHVIDYVQFRDPHTTANITAAMADPAYLDATHIHYQWSTNGLLANPLNPPSYGLLNQIAVSDTPSYAPATGGQWADPGAFLPAGLASVVSGNQNLTELAESEFFNAFFTPNPSGGFVFTGNSQIYYNTKLQIQAPYTPTRVVFAPFLLQANDPLVHYLASDLNAQTGARAAWTSDSSIWTNGIWSHVDDLQNSPLPTAPLTPVGGRYQPWGVPPAVPVQGQDTSGYDLEYKDPLVWQPDDWDFPTNLYPSVGWMGRVHRGTPWQTVYLKSKNVLADIAGTNVWARWTGDIAQDYFTGLYIDGSRSAPLEDRLLFDIFTTRFNDNSVRGTLPVNAGAGMPDGGLADWSALFSGMVALSNSAPVVFPTTPVTYTNLIINPAGVNLAASPLWQIVTNINAIRADTNLFPFQSFIHAGDILEAPALSDRSPFLNWSGPFQATNGISDELYEWLPQQMMGLVRESEPRYVLYCYGQALRPAPGGEVVSGGFSQMITNYQVVAESAVRVVIRVDNADTPQPHAVVESYNVLPPN